MAGSSIVAIGSASVTTTGALTDQLLKQIASVTAQYNVVTVAGGSTSLPASDGNYDQVLTVPATDTGLISVPGGYAAVIYLGTGSLVSNDPKEAIIGDLTYTGHAGTVIGTQSAGGTGANGVVSNNSNGAMMSFATGNELIFAEGAGDTLTFDSGFASVLGGSAASATVGAAATVLGFFGDTNTINAAAGVSTLIAGANNVVQLGLGSVALAAGGTIMGGAGDDTVFATGNNVYQGSAASTGSSVFIGGTGTSTVYTAQNEVAFGGPSGDDYIVKQGGSFQLVGFGGADSVQGGGTGSQITVWANAGEKLTVTSSIAGGTYVIAGNNVNMNLSGSQGSDKVVTSDMYFSGQSSVAMSTAGQDTVVLFSPEQFGATGGPATITVSNWQASDVFLLYSFGVAGGYTDADVTSALQQLASGNSFTLTDGTTVQFTGLKPDASHLVHF